MAKVSSRPAAVSPGRTDLLGQVAVTVVLTPPASSRRARSLRMLVLFLLAALPVAAILVVVVGWAVAVAYTVLQTGFLMFGVRQQGQATLRIDDAGVQFEPGSFVVRASWPDIDKVAEVTLPSGPTEALVLRSSGLRWTLDAGIRRQITAKAWDRVIPLTEFEADWRSGRIGQALHEHRPDLL
ncbi:MAG: hypothetical protein JWM05_200 [Acidimicrobiales bacterium]|nr:hypothetical protein [Acidimicrobiales bacterium]